jgi:hypothetical protein
MMKWAREKAMRRLRVIFFVLGLGIVSVIASPSWAEDKEILWVDRFAGSMGSNGIPEGWALERSLGSQSKIAVEKENGGYFLYLRCVQDNFGLKKDLPFEIKKFPYINWRWKVKELPKGGDVRKRETDDQAGQLYVLFPKFPATVNTRSMGYIWDALAPVGLAGTSTAYSKMKYVVLQSGPEKINQWIRESRNVYEDYRKLFQEEPPTAGGVLLYINTQHTDSSADCSYADIYFSSSPPKK